MSYKNNSGIVKLISAKETFVSLDNIQIKQMENSIYFKALDKYPQTVGQLKILISSIDKIGIFDDFDMSNIKNLDGVRLDAIYIVLRLFNKTYNSFLSNSIGIIIKELDNIFRLERMSSKSSFTDQLMQDSDLFINKMICENREIHKDQLITFLKETFEQNYYQNIFRKNNISIDFLIKDNDYAIRNLLEKLHCEIKEFNDSCKKFKNYLSHIFDTNKSLDNIFDVIQIKKNDLKNLLKEHSMELEIYFEQKLEYDYQIENKINRKKELSANLRE
jgi:hypothetical protein